MNLGQMTMEVYRAGFDDLGPDRIKRWINESYHEVCNEADWPFLETSVTAASPQTITDLRRVISVHDATNKLPLRPTSRSWIIATFGDTATATGSLRFYWVENTSVKVYPANTTNTTVYYLKVPTDLSANTDSPTVPSRFHTIIVDGAIRRAFERRGDLQSAQAVEGSRRAKLDVMKRTLLTEYRIPEVDDQAQAPVLAEQPPRQ